MISLNNKIIVLISAVALITLINSYLLYNNSEELEKTKKSAEINAKEMESLKMDVALLLKSEKNSVKNSPDAYNNSYLTELRDKMLKMKEQIRNLKKNDDKTAANKYIEREERVWKDHTDKVKEDWTTKLSIKLNEQKFEQAETEDVLYNYRIMLDKMSVTLLEYYREEIDENEFNSTPKVLARDFFYDTAHSIGEQKASIVLGIIFPDDNFRKQLFSNE